MSTLPPTTPPRWENMTTGQTPPPHPAEPTTPAETRVLPPSYIAMVMGNTDSFCELLPYAPPMCSWHLISIGALLDHFA